MGAAAAETTPSRVTIDTKGTVRTGGPKGQPFRGNQYVKTAPVAGVAEAAGRGLTVVGVTADSVELYNGKMSAGKFSENRAADAIGLLAGPIGALYAGIYFIADQFYPGGFNQLGYDAGRAQLDAQIQCGCPAGLGP